MCGLSGVILKVPDRIRITQYIEEMNNKIEHRGPDGQGVYYNQNIGFGHRRLSIIDLGTQSNQPMHYNSHTIIFNGEIYNFKQLRQELKLLGYCFQTNSDTEVLLTAYVEWGDECISKLNGMWAFAIHNRETNKVFISRDRFGIKPLYFMINSSNEFFFASEPKQLYTNSLKKVNTDTLNLYLLNNKEETTEETFFEGIKKLPAGHNLTLDTNTLQYSVAKYYDLESAESNSNFDTVFTSSIDLQLTSDVPLGLFLSGGIDSSLIAFYASKRSHQSLKAIHGRSIQKEWDESKYANIVANKCDIPLFETAPTENDFHDLVESTIYQLDEPFGSASILMQNNVMRKAAEQGCKVMLDGQGADEVFLGYENTFIVYFMNLMKQKRSAKIAYEFLRLKNHKVKRKALYNRLKTYNDKQISNFDINKYIRNNLIANNIPKLLKYADRNSMANSIEVRLPFLDHRVVEHGISLPVDQRIKHGYLKYHLRKNLVGKLPNSIVWRTNKFGFEAPEKNWLEPNRNLIINEINNNDYLAELVKQHNPNFDNLKTLWKYYNVAKWQTAFSLSI
ncbi:asparagine synthase (glutamine-hydrolyzing) [Pseudoalteromonas sp. C2R02]|uniref:asparagine synthase (glutamine-hydrolyzing) n=1 Tax=Pseudoalteromonas sp. C2R02 TaxID=2841565 RepID=UPI001C0815C7|nr:asparagine synthase (glutamine-hydrolyzing) [Pseudoalteromonas sp. C2R02]MBU2971741.1 asparagine synthase (glutamine-hydrolyzing) [Pseudoalteromonas sp. C2R02]